MFDAAIECARGVLTRSSSSRLHHQASALTVHIAVPPVLDCIVTAVAKSASDLCPAFAHLIHHALDHKPFVRRDGSVVERWLEILVESFSALLGRTEVHLLRDSDPIVGSLFVHQLHQGVVLLWDPRATAVIRRHDNAD